MDATQKLARFMDDVKAGADALVAGNAVFKTADPALALNQLRQAVTGN